LINGLKGKIVKKCFVELTKLILKSDLFEKSHQELLKNIVYSLSLESTDNIIDVNNEWKTQIEIETSIVFLVGFYTGLLSKQDIVNNHRYDETLLSIPDKPDNSLRKYTVDEKKALVKLDNIVYRGMLKHSLLNDLIRNLENLQKIVFRRDKKLENLTINYRREQEADSKI
jgi:hypothetical protein